MPQTAEQKRAAAQAARHRALDAALQAGQHVQFGGRAHHAALVRVPGYARGIQLFGPDGNPNADGIYWAEHGGSLDIWDGARGEVEEGGRTYAFVRGSAKRTLLRRWDHARGDFVVTKAGEAYYRHHRRSYIVELPVWHHYHHPNRPVPRNWGHYQEYLPLPRSVENLAAQRMEIAGVRATEAERRAYMREAVMAILADREMDIDWTADRLPPDFPEIPAAPVVAWDSDQHWTYDPTREIRFDEQITTFDHHRPHIEVLLGRPLRGIPMVPDEFLEKTGVYPMTWDRRENCAAVQLALALQRRSSGKRSADGHQNSEWRQMLSLGQVKERLDQVFSELRLAGEYPYEEAGWREVGVTAHMIQRVCWDLGASCMAFHSDRCVKRWDPPGWKPDGNMPLVIFNIWGEHAFFYRRESHNALGGHVPIDPRGHRDIRLVDPSCREEDEEDEEQEQPHRVALFEDMQQWPWFEDPVLELLRSPPRAKVSWFWTVQIAEVRAQLIELQVRFCTNFGRTTDEIRSLTVLLPQNRRLRIKRVPEDCEKLAVFAARLGLEYHGESHAALGHRAVMKELQPKRSQPGKNQREAVVTLQGGRCSLCDERLDPGATDVDHLRPLSAGGGNERSNLQALCRECHRRKTEEESLAFEPGVAHVESLLSPELHAHFLRSPKPRQLVSGAKGASYPDFHFDVRGCRRNALLTSTRRLPVFCPLDGIRPYVPEEHGSYDYLFVDAGPAATLPYTGPRFYWAEAVDYMLAEGLIERGDLRCGLVASDGVEPSRLRRAFAKVEETWAAVAEELPCCGEAGPLAKATLLGTIGLWNAGEGQILRGVVSTHQADAPGAYRKRPAGDGAWDFLVAVRRVSHRTMRPWGQVSLDMEQVRVAQGLRWMQRSFPEAGPPAMVVDSLHPTGPPHVLEAMREAPLEALGTYSDGRPVFQRKHTSFDQPPLPTNAQEPTAAAPTPPCPPVAWDSVDETQADVASLAVENGGLLLTGPPGTGKTWLARRMMATLRERGETVHSVAFTHRAACLIRGHTILHFVRKYRQHSGFWLFVDEASQIPVHLWGELALFLHAGVRFVVIGDFQGQLLPVCDSWREALASGDIERSGLLHSMVRGKHARLTVYRRGQNGDAEHFAWLSGFYGSAEPVGALVDQAAERYPFAAGDFDAALALSNRTRLRLNALLNLRRRPAGALLVRKPKDHAKTESTMAPQNMHVWPGLVLVGSVASSARRVPRADDGTPLRGGTPLRNGCTYVVEAVGPEVVAVALAPDMREDAEGEPPRWELSHRDLAAHLRLSHCMTYYSAQGSTFRGAKVLLLDVRGRHFGKRHLLVAVSRVTLGRDLRVADAGDQRDLAREASRAFERLEAA